jgi:ubiquitin-protein ligase
MDLLRAAIVGPAGTPYHDGLFFFDVHFPPEYPRYPPVCYHFTPAFPSFSPFYTHLPRCNLVTKTYSICTESSLPFGWASDKSKPIPEWKSLP